MNIMELGAIGELVGGVAVIGSLVYVGFQVRQNTISIQGSNSQSVADAALRFVTTLGSNPQIALTLNRGLTGEDLDAGEQAQFAYLFLGWARQTEQCYFLFRKGTLDTELWDGLIETSRAFLGSPGGARMWPRVRSRVRAAFREYVEREVLPTASETAVRNFLGPMTPRSEAGQGA